MSATTLFSPAFDRYVTLRELDHWSTCDLETLKAETNAQLETISSKVFLGLEQDGVVPKRLLHARRVVLTFSKKLKAEIHARTHPLMSEEMRVEHAKYVAMKEEAIVKRRELELAKAKEISKRHAKHQDEYGRRQYLARKHFYSLLRERFGEELVDSIAEEARALALAESENIVEAEV